MRIFIFNKSLKNIYGMKIKIMELIRIKYFLFNWFLFLIRLMISMIKLKFKIMLKIDPTLIWKLLLPKWGFNNQPETKRKYVEIVDCKEDKILNPKILSSGNLNE